MPKVDIVVGTRPNFIKITQFERAFSAYGDFFDYRLIHTGQHYDQNMSDIFFAQLGLKQPDIHLDIPKSDPGKQIGAIISELTNLYKKDPPDLLMVVGDVNSTLAAGIAGNKSGIPLAHLESGLRSFDRSMPEEVNRVLIDIMAEELFVTEQSGLDNLQREPLNPNAAIHLVGNTMIDTLIYFEDQIQSSDILEQLNIEPQKFALMTMHRPVNVDREDALHELLTIIEDVTLKLKLIFPIHPRTRARFEQFGLSRRLENNSNVFLSKPLGYFEFQKLIAESKLIMTDSGGIQEEACYRKVPCLTLREHTERPSTIEVGTNTLVSLRRAEIQEFFEQIMNNSYKIGRVPPFWDGKSTQRVVKKLYERFMK